MDAITKPLGIRAYGSICHLPGSRMTPSDRKLEPGMFRICCEKLRDKHDRIIVQEKLDGSCVAVARIGDELHALGRAGWPAQSSKYEQHQLFADWVRRNTTRFLTALEDGERLCGEWLAQAHGTKYNLLNREPFVAFDIMRVSVRLPFDQFCERAGRLFSLPPLLHEGGPLAIESALAILGHYGKYGATEQVEGAVWRVERKGNVDFLGKYVRPDKIDGCYLPELSGEPSVWNWRP